MIMQPNIIAAGSAVARIIIGNFWLQKKNKLICYQINVLRFIYSLFNVNFYIVYGCKITDHL